MSSTEVKYLHSLVLSENGDWSLYISFSMCLVSLDNVVKLNFLFVWIRLILIVSVIYIFSKKTFGIPYFKVHQQA